MRLNYYLLLLSIGILFQGLVAMQDVVVISNMPIREAPARSPLIRRLISGRFNPQLYKPQISPARHRRLKKITGCCFGTIIAGSVAFIYLLRIFANEFSPLAAQK